VKTVVLDATELARDWLCRGLKYQLIEHMLHATWLNVSVPAPVFEETIANYGRAVEQANRDLNHLSRERRRLGLGDLRSASGDFNFRDYLVERFDERLGIEVLPWPKVSHVDLVARAVARRPPFDQKGGGYRDSLVWASVLELAREGADVALVSSDKAFAGDRSHLAAELQAEADETSGSVELVQDFSSWLLAQLPWESEDLAGAVATSRDEAFYNFYLQSDLQDDLVPTVEELGFRWWPDWCSIEEVRWGGKFERVEASAGPDGLTLAEYDLDQFVAFEAEFSEVAEPEPGWEISSHGSYRRLHVTGEIPMIARVAVLFGDAFGLSVDELSWRRADGAGPGFSTYRPELDPDQLSLLDELSR